MAELDPTELLRNLQELKHSNEAHSNCISHANTTVFNDLKRLKEVNPEYVFINVTYLGYLHDITLASLSLDLKQLNQLHHARFSKILDRALQTTKDDDGTIIPPIFKYEELPDLLRTLHTYMYRLMNNTILNT